ncbi:50S ribosomal protein L6 [Candidatus Woesearchaeota archaeon]|nr:50S ribosomal protein L6 [Candidatus Woesearchaeota archaeon]
MEEDKRKEKAPYIEAEIELPEGVTPTLDKGVLTLNGPKGEVTRDFFNPQFTLAAEGNKINIKTNKNSKKNKMMLGTTKAHINNIIRGITKGHDYELKICSGHFPMNVSISNKKLVIKNFIGEKFPRQINILDGVDVKIENDIIKVNSVDIELAGRQSALIEEGCKRSGYDRRIFQDGIYIIKKDGKSLK